MCRPRPALFVIASSAFKNNRKAAALHNSLKSKRPEEIPSGLFLWISIMVPGFFCLVNKNMTLAYPGSCCRCLSQSPLRWSGLLHIPGRAEEKKIFTASCIVWLLPDILFAGGLLCFWLEYFHMLWILTFVFLLAAILYNPIYIELFYSGQRLSLNWLPRVFCGAARPFRLPWPKARHKADREIKHKAALFPRAYLSHLLRAHIGALVLEHLSARGLLKHSPAAAALSYGLVQSGIGIWKPSHFLFWSEIDLQPFAEENLEAKARIVLSLKISHLIRRSMKWRFGI